MRVLFLAVYAFVSASNAAAEESSSALEVSGEVSVVSDYRWRGVSLTDNDPALQGGVYVGHTSGLYAGAWASAPAGDSGDEELTLSFGSVVSLMGGDFDLSVEQFLYPDLDDADYANLVALYERPLGAWTARARFEYAPTQQNLSDPSTYFALEAERPIGDTGFSLTGSAGWEEGYFTLDGEKWDYSLGAHYQISAVGFGFAIIGTDEDAPPGEADVYGTGPVFSVDLGF